MKRFAVLFSLFFLAVSPVWAKSVPITPPNDVQLRDSVRNYHRVDYKLATGGKIADGGIKRLSEQGFAAIIDLRTPPEGVADEEQQAAEYGLEYYNIPVSGSSGITPGVLDKFAGLYPTLNGPVLLHCASGNRAGALWMAYLLRTGVAVDEAADAGRAIGMKDGLEKQVREDYCKSC